jgi:hypothetical protein
MSDDGTGRLVIVPTTLRQARAFVGAHHRHHGPPQGGILAIAAAREEVIVGVVILGRPVARLLQDGFTAEVTRLATMREADVHGRERGPRNACSLLYAAAWRVARALGYRRLVTYTLPEEGGASLHGAGWRCVGEAGGGSWSRDDRPRFDLHPTKVKLRWEVHAGGLGA